MRFLRQLLIVVFCILLGSDEEKNWKRRNPNGYKLHETSFTTGSTLVHQAANKGDHQSVSRYLSDKPELVNARDINGWMPLHVSIFAFFSSRYECV